MRRPIEESFAVLMRSLVDQELSAKIESELQIEKDIRDSQQYPATIQDYLDNSSFKVEYQKDTQAENTDGHSYMTPLVKKKSS